MTPANIVKYTYDTYTECISCIVGSNLLRLLEVTFYRMAKKSAQKSRVGR